MTNKVEHPFMCLLAISLSSLDKCLLKSFTHFQIELFVILLLRRSSIFESSVRHFSRERCQVGERGVLGRLGRGLYTGSCQQVETESTSLDESAEVCPNLRRSSTLESKARGATRVPLPGNQGTKVFQGVGSGQPCQMPPSCQAHDWTDCCVQQKRGHGDLVSVGGVAAGSRGVMETVSIDSL